MTKGERVAHYFELASMPEHLPYDSSHFKLELDISDEDIENYRQEMEMRLLRYYYAAQQSALWSKDSDYERLAGLKKELELSAEDISSHLEWLDVCRKNSHFTKVDAKEIAMKAAK